MPRANAAVGTAKLVIIIFFMCYCAPVAQAQTVTPTPDACATDGAARWATVLAYESPTPTETSTPTETPTPTATPTVYADIALSAVLVSPYPIVSDTIAIEVGLHNIGTGVVTESFEIQVYQQTGLGQYNYENFEWGSDIAAGQGVKMLVYYQVVNAEWLQVNADYSDGNAANNHVYVDFYPANPTVSPTPTATPAFITMTLPYSTTARIFLDTDIGETSTLVALALCAVSVLFALSLSRLR